MATSKSQTRSWGRQLVGLEAAVVVLVILVFIPWRLAHAQVIRRVHIRQPLVALTFDDGPGPQTLAIAEILKRERVPATFFEVGRSIAANPQVTRALAEDGFEIEDHSWTHPANLDRMHPLAVYTELQRTANLIRAETGRYPTYFRPPHGTWTGDVTYEARRVHLRTILWSVDPGDWIVDDPARLTSSVVDWVRPGAIIVMHDNLQDGPTVVRFRDRRGTREALPRIIATLRSRGYRFVTVAELLRTAGIPNLPLR